MKKWIKVKHYGRYVLWKNVKGGYKESFWPCINPNKEKDLFEDSKRPQKYVPRPRPFQFKLEEFK